MASEVSSKIAKFAHDYRSRLLQEQGKSSAKMTKYDVALFMKNNGALSESEFNSWVKEKEGQAALQLTTQQQEALKRGTIFNFANQQSYLDSDEVSEFTLGNVLGFEKTTNEKTGKTEIKSKAVSRKQFSVAEEMKKQSFMTYIKSLPTPLATYTELMRSIEFDKLDNQGKMEMTLKIYGEKFNEAKKKGDKQAMKDYLLDGLGVAFQLACQKADSTIGIKQFKEWAKERSGLNFLVDLVDKYVDDGDDATLSFLEKNWEGIKGFGDALDGFIGTQAIAFIGALELAGAAAGTGALGQVFNIATKGYFLYDGGKMMVNGTIGYYNAETKQEARVAGQEFGMGTVIFAGTLKSVIGEIQAYRASHSAPEGQGGLPELSDANKALLEQNLPAVQNQAQATTDLAFLQQNGIEIVKFSPEAGFELNVNGNNHIVAPAKGTTLTFENGVSDIAGQIREAVNGLKRFDSSDIVPEPYQTDGRIIGGGIVTEPVGKVYNTVADGIDKLSIKINKAKYPEQYALAEQLDNLKWRVRVNNDGSYVISDYKESSSGHICSEIKGTIDNSYTNSFDAVKAAVNDALARVENANAAIENNGVTVNNVSASQGSIEFSYKGKQYQLSSRAHNPQTSTDGLKIELAKYIEGKPNEFGQIYLSTPVKGEANTSRLTITENPFAKDAINETITAAEAKIATTEVSDAGGLREFATAKDAQGNVVKTTVKDGVVENNTYIDGGNTVSQTTVEGKVIGTYIHDGKTGTYFDAKGNVITEQAFGEAVAKAATEGYAKTKAPVADTKVQTLQIDAKTQQAVQDGLIRTEYIEDVENALTNPNVQNLVRNTMLRAKTQAELQYFADKFKNSDSVANRYTALKAEAYKDQLPVKPSDDTLGTATGQRILPEGEAAASVGKEVQFTVPEGTTVEQARAKIAELQQELKSYGAGTDRYDQIHMDRIQEQIRAYREVAPLDRTNLEEVMQASPSEVFQPVKADNIKGQGISFKPYVPKDPEALAKVTYRAVPLYTNARTVTEMIRIAARDGVKIEMVQDAEGNYYPGVKAIWSEGGYFKLDRDSYVVKYGEIDANDPYVDQAWAQQNKYINAEGKEVIMDCAIVAADKSTAADIMPHSYMKANGAQLSASDKHRWEGFDAHKDPDGVVNAVAYESPKELQTLEGKITTDVTMGDVEGNVYNKYNDLKKQIIKDKLVANPDDPNSQAFIDLVKAGKDEEAIALLREATKVSQTPTEVSAKKPYTAPEMNEVSAKTEGDVMAAPNTPKTRTEILDQSGFTESKIAELKEKSGFYGPELIDEVLNMVVYLEGEVANGKTINRSLIESAINKFSPGASGGSSAVQRNILANVWNRGAEVYNAYGQKAPGQSTFSTGNLKAKWNKVKDSVKDYYEYKKWELGFGEKTDAAPKPAEAEPQASADAESVHSKIANGDFGAFGKKSASKVGKELKAYAELNGLKFIERGSEFELQDANGNVVREAHEGFFDGQWYDHHQVFDSNNNITNRFVLDRNGKLQSTVEYFYDADGNATMSVGYGGKAGTDVMVFEGPNRSQLTIQQFIEKYGFEPTYYREINPGVQFESPVKSGEVKPVSSAAEMEAQLKADAVPAPGSKEAILSLDFSDTWNPTELQAWADKNNLTLTYTDHNRIAIFKDSNGQTVRRVTQDWDNKSKVYDDRRAIYDDNGNEVGQLAKYADEAEPEYIFREPGESIKTYAHLGKDGLWYTKEYNMSNGSFEKQVLSTNPITGEPQGVKVNVAPAETTGTVTVGAAKASEVQELDLNMCKTFDAFAENIDAVKSYAEARGLTVETNQNVTFPEISFVDANGRTVRSLSFVGDEIFHDNYFTYDAQGRVKTSTSYMAVDNNFSGSSPVNPDGKLAHSVQYFYDVNGHNYSIKIYGNDAGKIDLAIDGVRQGPGKFYSAEQLKSEFGIDVDTSVIGTTAKNAQAKFDSSLGVKTEPSKPAQTATTQTKAEPVAPKASEELLTQLADFKGPDGKPFLSATEINSLIENCQNGFVTDGKPIPNYEAKIMAVLNNPEEIAQISTWKSKAAGIWRAIQDPLSSTENANPELFGLKPVQAPQNGFVSQLADFKGPDGKKPYTLPDISDMSIEEQAEALAIGAISEPETAAIMDKIRNASSIKELTDIAFNDLQKSDIPEDIRNTIFTAITLNAGRPNAPERIIDVIKLNLTDDFKVDIEAAKDPVSRKVHETLKNPEVNDLIEQFENAGTDAAATKKAYDQIDNIKDKEVADAFRRAYDDCIENQDGDMFFMESSLMNELYGIYKKP